MIVKNGFRVGEGCKPFPVKSKPGPSNAVPSTPRGRRRADRRGR